MEKNKSLGYKIAYTLGTIIAAFVLGLATVGVVLLLKAICLFIWGNIEAICIILAITIIFGLIITKPKGE